MKTSVRMEEIRKIRDENSLRHLSQTPEETEKELADSLKWFLEEMERIEARSVTKIHDDCNVSG